MNKYLWAECPQEFWPVIKTLMAKSYNDAVEKLIMQYGNELDDDKILDTIEDWEQLRDYLNENYSIAGGFFKELTQAAATLLSTAQAEIYAIYEMAEDAGAGSRLQEFQNIINLDNLSLAMGRK